MAISNSGYKFPSKKVIVNLAPASLRKEGPAFDPLIALAVLAASGIVPKEGLEETGVVGELSLDEGLRGVPGALSMAEGARRKGLKALILPEQNALEAASIGGPSIYGVRSLKEAVGLIAGEKDLVSMSLETNGEEVTEELVDDSADVAGQSYAKRALEVTAAGGHNILIFDPNGTHP